MANRRVWTELRESTRKAYLRRGGNAGLTDPQVRVLYESGGNISVLRGHRQRPGVSEKQWTRLRQAARDAGLHNDKDTDNYPNISDSEWISLVLESLLTKRFTYSWILEKLSQKENSRNEYRSWVKRRMRQEFPARDEGYNPGRQRFHNRNQLADIELYYYH